MNHNKVKFENIQWGRFFAIILIVIIHSFIPVDPHLFPHFYNFQVALSQVIGRIAVPFLFLISGYLFYYKTDLSFQTYKKKLSNRMKSLVIPYFIWNIIILLFFLLIQESNLFGNFITGNFKRISDFNLNDWLSSFFIRPIANQFWFIRDLILLNLVSFLIIKILKNFHILFLSFIFLIWMLNFDDYFLFIKNEAIIFYSLGLMLALFNVDLNKLIIHKKSLLILLSLLYLSILIFLPPRYPFIELTEYAILKFSIVIGILIFWQIINYTAKYLNKNYFISDYSFIIFALHIPLNLLIVRTLIKLIPLNELTCFIIFFSVFMGSVVLPLGVGILMKKYLPRIYAIIVGNR